jgi:hypothetical protein
MRSTFISLIKDLPFKVAAPHYARKIVGAITQLKNCSIAHSIFSQNFTIFKLYSNAELCEAGTLNDRYPEFIFENSLRLKLGRQLMSEHCF